MKQISEALGLEEGDGRDTLGLVDGVTTTIVVGESVVVGVVVVVVIVGDKVVVGLAVGPLTVGGTGDVLGKSIGACDTVGVFVGLFGLLVGLEVVG